jgi:hypothetical protein
MQQQHHQQQPQQHPGAPQQGQLQLSPRFLLELPGPALRRVLQLASSSESPALCRLCRVSKAVKAAAVAAQPPMCVDFTRKRPSRPADQKGGLSHRILSMPFMRRQAARAKPSRQVEEEEEEEEGRKKKWLGSHVQSVQQLLLDVTSGDVWLQVMTSRAAAVGAPLEQLLMRYTRATASLFQQLALFKQLQVLILQPFSPGGVVDGAPLLQALSSLKQLRQLALDLSKDEYSITGDELLRALPPNLEAADLALGGPACSSNSLAHLVRLASLKLKGTDIVSDLPAAGQQQQVAGALATMSASARAASWFAPPSLEAAEIFIEAGSEAGLARLSSCARLHKLRVQFGGHFPDPTGVSALTQVKRLRMEAVRLGEGVIISTIGGELKFLKQLQQLELPYALLNAGEAGQWLLLLGCLEELVLLVLPEECWDQEGLEVLSSVLSEWRSSSQASSSTPPVTASRSSGPAVLEAAACKLQRLQLALWMGDSPGYSFDSKGVDEAYTQLQVAAAGLAADLPWLQVACKRDAYSSPCWAAPPPKA